MTNENKAVQQFFDEYPDAPCVHEVAGQLFHDNAKEAADARASYYGLTVNTIKGNTLLSYLKVVKEGEGENTDETDNTQADVSDEEKEAGNDLEFDKPDSEGIKGDGSAPLAIKASPKELKMPKAPNKSGKKTS